MLNSLLSFVPWYWCEFPCPACVKTSFKASAAFCASIFWYEFYQIRLWHPLKAFHIPQSRSRGVFCLAERKLNSVLIILNFKSIFGVMKRNKLIILLLFTRLSFVRNKIVQGLNGADILSHLTESPVLNSIEWVLHSTCVKYMFTYSSETLPLPLFSQPSHTDLVVSKYPFGSSAIY